MDVSLVKVSKDKERRYFNFSIENDDTLYCGVCYSEEKQRLFSDIISERSHSGIEIKRFRFSYNIDIIVNDFSSVKKTELNFERKSLQLKIFAVKQVINECAIYDIVDLNGLAYNLQTETEPEKDRKTLGI